MAFAPIQQLPGADTAVGIPVLAGGQKPIYLKTNLVGIRAPLATDDIGQGYSVGSTWINTLGPAIYQCLANAIGAAIWGRLDNVQAGFNNSLKETYILGNSFVLGNVIRPTPTGIGLAKADTFANAQGLMGVIETASASSFTVIYSGALSWPSHGFAVGTPLYLSSAFSGTLTTAQAGLPGLAIPVAIALDSNRLLVLPSPLARPPQSFGTDIGSANAYVVSPQPALAAYYPGLSLSFLPSNTNTGAATINVNGLGIKSILLDGSNSLIGGEMVAGKAAQLLYDGTNFQILNPATSIQNGVLVGAILGFPMSTPPSGWLAANGAAVLRTTYAALFAYIGTTYGAGDGTTTFNLPDLRGQFPRFFDAGKGIDPGRTIGSNQAAAFASHTHTVSDPGHGHGISDPGHAHLAATVSQTTQIYTTTNWSSAGFATGAASPRSGVTTSAATTGISISGATTGISIAAAGGAETRPVNVALLACIKF